MKREFKEETGLKVELLGKRVGSIADDVKRVLVVPFAVNVHNVGDHDHACFFYGCRVVGGELKKNERELNEIKWFTPDELGIVPDGVRELALKALELFN